MTECKEGSLAAMRARFAYDEVANWGDLLRKRATPRVRSLPVQVRTQGLQVTIADLMGDTKPEARYLRELIAQWILEKGPRKPFDPMLIPSEGTDAGRLLGACVKADRAAYLAARAEVIALLDQVKIFADALWKSEVDQP